MSAQRLLIADDEESLLDFLSLLFQQEGYEVETALSAEGGAEGLFGPEATTSCSATS